MRVHGQLAAMQPPTSHALKTNETQVPANGGYGAAPTAADGATSCALLPTPDYLLTPGMQRILGGGSNGAAHGANGYPPTPDTNTVGGCGLADGDVTVALLPVSELLKGGYTAVSDETTQQQLLAAASSIPLEPEAGGASPVVPHAAAASQVTEQAAAAVGVDDVLVHVEASQMAAEDEPPAAAAAALAAEPATGDDQQADPDNACAVVVVDDPEEQPTTQRDDEEPLPEACSSPKLASPLAAASSSPVLPQLRASESPTASHSPVISEASTPFACANEEGSTAAAAPGGVPMGSCCSPVAASESSVTSSLALAGTAGSVGLPSESDDEGAVSGSLFSQPTPSQSTMPAPQASPTLLSLQQRQRALAALEGGSGGAKGSASPAHQATPKSGVRESIPLFVLHPGVLGGAVAAVGHHEQQLLVGGHSADDDAFLSAAPGADAERDHAPPQAWAAAAQQRSKMMLGGGARRVAPATRHAASALARAGGVAVGSGAAFASPLEPVAEALFTSPSSSQG